MMDQGSTYNKNYSADEIRSYVLGQMNRDEMHAIEKAALEDPFLEDAIEGMREALQNHGEPAVMTPLATLKTALEEKTRAPKVVPLFQQSWIKIAAAAIVLVIAGTWMYNSSTQKQESQPLAVQPSAPDQLSQTDGGTISGNLKDSLGISATIENKIDPKDLKPAEPVYPAVVIRENAKALNNREYRNDLGKRSADTLSVIAKSNANTEESIVQNDEVTKAEELSKPPVAVSANKEEAGDKVGAFTNTVFKGKVVDPANNPLSNVVITPLNSKQSFLTDQNGFFQIPVTEPQITVTVSSVGYNSRNFQLNNQSLLNQLSLEPTTNKLSEVVITQPKKDRSNALKRAPSVSFQAASPEGGWVEFEKYVEANNKLKGTRQGQVVVSFAINRKNELSDFRIEQSAHPDLDAEAIRLIKEGPTWKLTGTKKDRVMVILRF